MAILDQIAQQRQRISERLTRVDAERTKLNGQLDELEVTERALKRFGGNGSRSRKAEEGSDSKSRQGSKYEGQGG